MPLSVFSKLGIVNVQPTNMILQLANRSVVYPWGVIEDLLVKRDKFVFLADFVLVDIDRDRDIPLVLGRPFLATGKTLIDVKHGKIILQFQDDKAVFTVHNAKTCLVESNIYDLIKMHSFM